MHLRLLHGLAWVAALACLALALNAALHTLAPGLLFSSDALYLPSFVEDWIDPTASPAGWITPPATYFFPDLPAVLVLRAFFGKQGLLVANAILQVLVLLGVMALLLGTATRPTRRGSLLATLTAVLALCAVVAFGLDGGVLAALFASGHHAGALLAGYACLVLYLRYPTKRASRYIAGLLCFLTAASDALFLIQFTLPFGLLLFLDRTQSVTVRARWLLFTLVAAGVGLLAPRALPRLTGIIALPIFWSARFQEFAGLPWFEGGRAARAAGELLGRPTWVWWTLFSLGLVPAGLAVVRLSRPRGLDRAASRVAVFALAAAGTGLAAGFAAFFFFGLLADRYLLGFYLFPFLALGVAAGSLIPRRFQVAVLVGSVAMGLPLLASFEGPATAIVPSKLAACLDRHRERFNLLDGYGDYWSAKQVSYFSREGLRVHPLERDLRPLFLVDNYHRYFETQAAGRVHNFVISDRLDLERIERRLGRPSATLLCGTSKILVYSGRAGPRMRSFSADLLREVRRWERLVGKPPYRTTGR